LHRSSPATPYGAGLFAAPHPATLRIVSLPKNRANMHTLVASHVREAMPPRAVDELLCPDQLAAELHNTIRTLARWRESGDGPAFTRVGPRCIRYARSAVNSWVAARSFPHRAAEAVQKKAA
jgi:hypothetical protein